MDSQAPTESRSLLSKAFKERIAVLGLSRRELTERSGLSRQTLHNIEHEGQIKFQELTLRTLDEALRWTPGTALDLINGIDNRLTDESTEEQLREKLSTLKWWIVERLGEMSIDDLERMVTFLEQAILNEEGRARHRATNIDMFAFINSRVDERARLIAEMKYLRPEDAGRDDGETI